MTWQESFQLDMDCQYSEPLVMNRIDIGPIAYHTSTLKELLLKKLGYNNKDVSEPHTAYPVIKVHTKLF